ncbi:flocculation protein FLO11-like isoform X2 [Sinocyclocheilus anshuiensis]|uniref:flocculation protein FLO11-like isoform X2 n=1 Tax=Sinocyclocheilus anshuiensis TaxID=1608454 RepID=UPI0007B97565|nr:PREDICTED: flocculation protein FLO11-like isoform X2 [Sinocyclocheilus anshuiensis]
MVSATHVIMTVHPVLVLLPILGLIVLPCTPLPLENGLRIVANVTVDDPGACGLNYCPKGEVCWKAIVNTKQSVCFLISCPNNTQNFSCENVTNFNDLLVELGVITNDSIHVGKNQTDKSALPYQSDGTSSSSNGTQPLPTEPNISISMTSTTTDPATLQINFTTITTTNLQTTPTEKAATTDAVAKPAITATIPTTPAVTSTTTTTPKPTTTSPKPSPTTTSTTTTTTTVAQIIIPKQSSSPSPSPSGTNMSASISPSVPTTPSFTPSTKLIQTSAASSDQKKPSQTMSKTSLSPSVVVSALPKDIPKGDQVMIEVARDPLTSHLLNTSSLLAVLLFGLLFFVVTVALILKQAYESYKRKDYTLVDYLINGMYSDSGV